MREILEKKSPISMLKMPSNQIKNSITLLAYIKAFGPYLRMTDGKQLMNTRLKEIYIFLVN